MRWTPGRCWTHHTWAGLLAVLPCQACGSVLKSLTADLDFLLPLLPVFRFLPLGWGTLPAQGQYPQLKLLPLHTPILGRINTAWQEQQETEKTHTDQWPRGVVRVYVLAPGAAAERRRGEAVRSFLLFAVVNLPVIAKAQRSRAVMLSKWTRTLYCPKPTPFPRFYSVIFTVSKCCL